MTDLDFSTFYRGDLDWLEAHTLFLTRHGSHAYGLARPGSDLDVKGVAVPPRRHLHGFRGDFQQAEAREPVDLVVYEIRKFFRLATQCNPNIIEVLWTDPEDHLLVTPLGERLLDARERFLSRKARHTFSGYAMSQLKRIKTHRRWLLEPPEEEPLRADFDLPERALLPRDQMLAAESAITKQLERWELDLEPLSPPARIHFQEQLTDILAEMSLASDAQWRAAARTIGLSENFLVILDAEKRYRHARKEWKHYQQWKANRNPDRAALEARFGYDSKHASHLVRLLRMCEEILRTGRVIVRRPDRDEILAIRDGAMSYDELIAWADAQQERIADAARTSPLPKAPDADALDALCVELVEAFYASR